jgi:cobalt-zinc-cadmium efflux system outer membrane protein
MFRYYLIFGLVLSGCSRVISTDGDVGILVEDRIESRLEGTFDELLKSELSADDAVQVALLNNPSVQALYAEVGISRADLIEAGLFTNPAYEIEVRYPHVRGLKTNIEYLLTSSLLDIFLIPLRTRLAEGEYEQTKLQVANGILDLAFDVRETYYALIAERKKIGYLQSKAQLVSILRDITMKQFEVGNVNALEYQINQGRFLAAQVEWDRSKAEVIRLEEKLNKLLGLCSDKGLILPSELPSRERTNYDICVLEEMALQDRLDLQAARYEMALIREKLGLKDAWTYSKLRGGAAGEREPGGSNLIGFGLAGEIPLFNYGQAARMRLQAELCRAEERLAALEIKVLSEVREAYKTSQAYLKITRDYQERLIPMQAKIAASSEALYNIMGLGLDKLLETKMGEILAVQQYTESAGMYLVAQVKLDRSVGGYLSKYHCGASE